MPVPDAQTRFSDRVADYVRHRPTYPGQVVEILRREVPLGDGACIADVGSGTGISSAMFLSAGFEVVAVEPNAEMRSAAEGLLGGNARFRSVAAPAEATTLADGSVDLVLAAQAFHWFDAPRARVEFARILRGTKPVALVWNDRQVSGSPFLDGYEGILRALGTDYAQVNHRNLTEQETAIHGFFDGRLERFDLLNHQDLDQAGLLGRALSSSYTPKAGDPRRVDMERALRELFARTSEGGVVRLAYVTRVYLGRLGASR
jgi:SAM-dependent methyltransferase